MEMVNSNSFPQPVFNVMRITLSVVPVVAGLDKFTNFLTHWEQYLHPALVKVLPFSPHVFMMIVGVIEIIAGIIVWIKPGIGGYIVAAWLSAIAVSLLAGGTWLDVAVRDLAMAVSAFSLAKMTEYAPSVK